MISLHADNWKIDSIKGILFDKDGTLIDSHIYWGRIIERRAMSIIRHYSLSNALFADLCLTMGYSIEIRRLRPEGPIALVSREEVIDILHEFLLARQISSSKAVLSDIFVREHEAFMEELLNYIKVLPGIREFLLRLRRYSIKTAVVTTDTIINTHEILRYLEMDNLFDVVIGKESTIEPKITGIPAREALRLLNLKPEEVVCIGDAPMDIIMAQKSNLKCGIGIATGQIGYEVLKEYSPFVANSMQNIEITYDN